MSRKKKNTYGPEKYTRGELAQLARRKMIQKDHGDKSKYDRKKYKNDTKIDEYGWYNEQSF